MTTNEKISINRERYTREVPQMIRTIKQERKLSTIFNEVRQFAYVLEVRERDLIDSIINY